MSTAAPTFSWGQLPATMAASFVNALQRGPKALLSWRHEEEEKALCLRAEGLKVEAGEARKQAQVLAQAVDLHQTRPALSLREWEALWGLHVLLRRNGFPRRLVYTRAEFYEAAGAKVSYRRGRRDFLSSDREDLDKAIQSLFERELVIYCHDEKRRGEIHFHILIDRGELREQGQSRANDRCFVTFHEIALEMIREQFVDLPPLGEVKGALVATGATGRGGGMQVDLELILWLHTHPYNLHEGGTCTHVDWEELADRLGLGPVLARGQRARARERLVKAYERAVQTEYLVRYDLDQAGGGGKVDRLVKNTAKLREHSRSKVLPAEVEGREAPA